MRTPGPSTRHAKEDALDDREYQLLLEATDDLDEPRDMQARFIVLTCGRLGMRAGELAHTDESWINWRENMIEVPSFDPCTKGRDGGPCGACRENAEQMGAANTPITTEQALEQCWSPKTSAGARPIPFDFDQRAALAVERFFERFDRYPRSRTSVNRRVKSAAEAAVGIKADDVYPHALRSTAATHHAGRGLNAIALQSMFGWAKLKTAQRYIRRSGKATARELKQIHSR
jgi:integrase